MLDIYNKAYPRPRRPSAGCLAHRRPDAGRGRRPNSPGGPVGEIGKLLAEASVALNSDVRLAASMKKAGNVLVPMLFDGISSQPQPGKADKPLPAYVVAPTRSAASPPRAASSSRARRRRSRSSRSAPRSRAWATSTR